MADCQAAVGGGGKTKLVDNVDYLGFTAAA